ncbi:DUF3575 domain-containing protein [Bacteroides sp.]|uniref:DUF3575 domain-containing protein n=1 Tax=Bacteroides sp. TaxID=29523 RepID=UPI003457C2DF
MKLKTNLLRSLIVALCLVMATAACSQEAETKKPKMKSSATAKETVYKPLKETEKVAVAKPAAKKAKPDAKKAKGTVQKKSAAKQKQNASQKKDVKKKDVKKKGAQKKNAKKKGAQKKETATKDAAKKDTPKKAKADSKRTRTDSKNTKPKAKAKPKAKSKSKSEAPSSRYIALKTNVPFLAVAVQNLALEVELHERISLDLPVMWSIGDIEREHGLRTFALQPEGRWWLKSVGTGHFFGLHAHVAWFNLKWEENRYQTGKRPLLGAGISYGYKLPLSAHWGAEFNIGAGYANMKYDTFYNIENGAQLDTRVRHYWGITRAGISLVYRF